MFGSPFSYVFFRRSPEIPLHNAHSEARKTAFWSIGLIILWLVYAPLQFGGQMSYIMVRGRSMTPLFRDGGLVLLVKADYYEVGDIVTYQYPKLGPVIHRIVGREGSRYIMKGDANTWLDSYRPEHGDILGKYWLYLPGVGKWFNQLRSPAMMALLVAVGLLMFGIS